MTTLIPAEQTAPIPTDPAWEDTSDFQAMSMRDVEQELASLRARAELADRLAGACLKLMPCLNAYCEDTPPTSDFNNFVPDIRAALTEWRATKEPAHAIDR